VKREEAESGGIHRPCAELRPQWSCFVVWCAVHWEESDLRCPRDWAPTLENMLRLTKKADYGLMALKYLAEQAQGHAGTNAQSDRAASPGTASALGNAPAVGSSAASAKAIAEAYHIPPQLLAKILQTLARAGLLVSHAGTNGGYALARAARDISAFQVIRAIDGPLFITSCITIHGTCDLHGSCTIKEPLRKVYDSITNLLSDLSIADLIEPNDHTASDHSSRDHALAGGLVSIAR
jgi:Rrf2 family protein